MTEENTPTEPSEEAPPSVPALTALVQETFPGDVLEHHTQHGDETIIIRRDNLLDVFAFLKNDERCHFDMMIDLTAVDYLPRSPRFEVVVHLKSFELGHRLRVKIPLEEDDATLPSIHGLWAAVNWYERECYEMYGIDFSGHPNLKVLLLYEGFEGNPLRKDYQKEKMQPLVPMRTVRERYDYGEIYTDVVTRTDAPNADVLRELSEPPKPAAEPDEPASTEHEAS